MSRDSVVFLLEGAGIPKDQLSKLNLLEIGCGELLRFETICSSLMANVKQALEPSRSCTPRHLAAFMRSIHPLRCCSHYLVESQQE